MERKDSLTLLLEDGFTLEDADWIRQHKLTKSITFDMYVEVLHQRREQGKTVDQLRAENDIPTVYAEARDGSLVRGNEHYPVEASPVAIKTDAKGRPLNTIENYLEIMRNDPHYDGIRFNVMTNRADYPVADQDGSHKKKLWDDSDVAKSLGYCEKHYLIYSPPKHANAFSILMSERQYNPIHELLNSLPEWDGVERCKNFFQKWLKADNTPLVQAAGQIVFDGAVSRAFSPGCKFDIAVVLIGERTGEGKSTLVRLLALEDEYFGEIQSMGRSPDKIYEDILGKWVIEIGEYMMKDDQQEQDSTKAFITRLADTHRTPYAMYPETHERRCVFIGTTNHREFLTDATSQRRWLPIVCHSEECTFVEGAPDHEEIKKEIRLCYAEALHRYKTGKTMLQVPKDIRGDLKEMQELSTVEDDRYGVIEDYCRMVQGKYVCAREIWRDALGLPIERFTMKPKREIKEIMRKIPFLVEEKDRKETLHDGRQRVFRITLHDGEDDRTNY